MKASELRPGQPQQRVTVSLRDSDVTIQCESNEHAREVLSFIEAISKTPLAVTGWDEPQSEQRKKCHKCGREASEDNWVVTGFSGRSTCERCHYNKTEPPAIEYDRIGTSLEPELALSAGDEIDPLATVVRYRKPQPEQFKAGDWVVATYTEEEIKAGEIYKVIDIPGSGYLQLDGLAAYYSATRFRRATAAEIAANKPADDDGWIAWHGGECPVDPLEKVDIRLVSGREGHETAGLMRWSKMGTSDDIAAYRSFAVKPAPQLGWVEVVTR